MLNQAMNYSKVTTVALLTLTALLAGCATPESGRERSINPGINASFEDPDVDNFVQRFEREERVVYQRREEIVAMLNLEPGMDAADIGAGTGFFSILMAQKVGPGGTVYAVDIADNFIEYIDGKAEEEGISNLKGIVGTPRSTLLEENSIDAAFICDSYHHFEFPRSTMASIRKALRPDGVLMIVDFERIEGITGDFVLNMVRGGKGTFTDEIIDDGFALIEQVSLTDDHYILKFRKRDYDPSAAGDEE